MDRMRTNGKGSLTTSRNTRNLSRSLNCLQDSKLSGVERKTRPPSLVQQCFGKTENREQELKLKKQLKKANAPLKSNRSSELANGKEKGWKQLKPPVGINVKSVSRTRKQSSSDSSFLKLRKRGDLKNDKDSNSEELELKEPNYLHVHRQENWDRIFRSETGFGDRRRPLHTSPKRFNSNQFSKTYWDKSQPFGYALKSKIASPHLFEFLNNRIENSLPSSPVESSTVMHVKSDSCLVVGKIPLPPFSPKLTRSVATEATRRPLVFSAMLSASNRRASATSGLSSSSFNASLNSNKFRATFGDRSSRRKPTPGRSPPPGCTTPYASGVASHLDFRVKAGTKSISPPRHNAVPPRNVSRSSIPSPPRAKNDAKTSIALGRLSMEDRNGIGENFSAEAERTSTSSSKNGVLPSPTNSSGSSSEEKNEEKNRQNSSVQKTDSPIVDKPPSSVMDENLFEEKNEMGILPKTTRDIGFSPTADKSVQFGGDSITSNISVEKPERLKTKFYPSPPPMKRGSSLGEGLDTKPDKISHSSQKHFSKEFKDSSINEKRRRCIASVNFFPEEGILQPNLEPSVSPSNQENVWSREKWEENVGNVRKLIERRRKHKCDKRHCSRNVDEQEPVRRDSRNSEVQTYPDDLRRISGEKRHSRKSSHNGVSAKVADDVADTKKREKRKDSKSPEEVAVLPSRKKESIVNEIVHKDTPFGEWRSGEELAKKATKTNADSAGKAPLPIKNDKIACGSAESAGKVTMDLFGVRIKITREGANLNRRVPNTADQLARSGQHVHGPEWKDVPKKLSIDKMLQLGLIPRAKKKKRPPTPIPNIREKTPALTQKGSVISARMSFERALQLAEINRREKMSSLAAEKRRKTENPLDKKESINRHPQRNETQEVDKIPTKDVGMEGKLPSKASKPLESPATQILHPENGDASLKDVLPLKFNRLSSNSKNNLAELMNAKHGKEVVKNEPEKRLYAKKLARRKSNTVPTTEKLTITPK